MRSSSADLDLRVGHEIVGRNLEVARGGTLPDAARRVVVRAVAGAEPAAEVPLGVRHGLALGDATQMRADADENEPVLVALLGAVGVGRGRAFRQGVVARAVVDEFGKLHVLRRLHLVLAAVADEHRLAAPDDRDGLSFLDGRQVDLGGGERCCRRVGVHLADERPQRHGPADACERLRRYYDEIAAACPVRTRRRQIGLPCLSRPIADPSLQDGTRATIRSARNSAQATNV